MTAEDPHLIPRVRQTLQWHADGHASPAMLAVLTSDAAALLGRLERLMRAYDDLLQADHANSVREAIRADDAARQLAAKDDLIRDAVRLIATKDDLIRALCVRTEAQSQLLSKRAEK